MSLDDSVSGVARESDSVSLVGDLVRSGNCIGSREVIFLGEEDGSNFDYETVLREAKMYHQSYCWSDSRRLLKQIARAGSKYLDRLRQDDFVLYNHLRVGGF